jgi:anthranilate 1,2-dioxygenase large subunit
MHKPVRVLGYSRQMVNGNWKLYAENLRDTYHASLLHEFFVTYGVDRATQRGGVKMDARHRHNMNHAYAATDTQEEARAAYAGTAGVALDRMRLRDASLLKYVPEFADGMNLAAPTIFPNMLLIQINNTLATRQIRPKAVDSFEIFQTVFGYADDDEEMTRHRILLANLVGPAGFVSMEDGEAIEIIQKATRPETTASAVFEMGGRGPLKDLAHRVTETPIRGFWSYWSELMGVEPEGAIRKHAGVTARGSDAIADLLAEYAAARRGPARDGSDSSTRTARTGVTRNVEQGLPNIDRCANKDMIPPRRLITATW